MIKRYIITYFSLYTPTRGPFKYLCEECANPNCTFIEDTNRHVLICEHCKKDMSYVSKIDNKWGSKLQWHSLFQWKVEETVIIDV